jgi:glycosyltransferase involved in cell wall biosynthesis
MRVLLVDLERAWRGGQAQGFLLLQGLRARGHDAQLLSVQGAVLAERARAAGIPVHEVPDTLRRAGAARLLHRLFGELRFEIIHANEAHALTAAWLAQAHHHAPLVAARRVAFPVSRGRLALARYRAAARILAVSGAVREQLLAAGLDPARIEVIADGVELCPHASAGERLSARRRWSIAEDERVAAYVAAFSAEKGHTLLLDAFAELSREVPHCRLLLAGDGPLGAELEEKASALNLAPAVIFAGFVEDLPSIYAACDIFLFPSVNEGLGTSLLGAMACALPVAAFSVGGIADIVEDGRNGLLVREITAPALAAAAARLLGDAVLSQRLGDAARDTVAARFTADRMVQETLAAFQRLVDERRPA